MKNWNVGSFFLGILILVASGLAFSGCSTSPAKALDGLRPGMDKAMVLDKVGSPSRTFRENGQDHWVYVYWRNDREWLRDVIFEDGRVAKVTRGVAKDPNMKELQNTNSLEEYEKKVREMQKKNKGKFKQND